MMKQILSELAKIPALWVFSVLFFMYQMGVRASIPNVLNEDLQRHFAIGSKELGALVSSAYMAYMLMQIPVGVIIDKFALKKIIFISFFLTALSLIGFVVTKNMVVAEIFQIILGLSAASSFAMIFKIATITFPKEKIALATTIALSCSSLGIIAFEIMLASFSKMFFWQDVVIWIGIAGLLLCACLLFFIKDVPNDTMNIANTTSAKKNSEQEPLFNTAKIIFGEKRFLMIGLFSLMLYGTGAAFSEVWGVSFIKHLHDVDIVTATSIVSMHFIGIMFGGPILAHVSGVLNSYTKMMILGSCLLLFAMLLITFADLSIFALYFVVFLLGVGASSNTFSFLKAMSLLPKKFGGSVTGTLNTMTMLGGTIMVSVVGLVIDISRGVSPEYSSVDYHCGLVALVFSALISVLAALCIIKKLG